MKKLITVLVALSLLFCFTACAPEAGGGAGGSGGGGTQQMPPVDGNTINGWYVLSKLIFGKPMIYELIYIDGTDIHIWEGPCYSDPYLYVENVNDYADYNYDSNHSLQENVIQINESDPKRCNFWDVDFELLTDTDGRVWLRAENGSYVYQKVYSPEWPGSRYDNEIDAYINGDSSVYCYIIDDAKYIVVRYNNSDYASDELDPDASDFTVSGFGEWSFTCTETTGTLTYRGNDANPFTGIPETYTRYVYPGNWPTLTSANSTYPAD